MVSDFYRLRVWFRHLVLLGCSCPAPSQTRFQAPEYAKRPKMAYSARIMPQSYILLLRPYYARNSAGRMCKGLLVGKFKATSAVQIVSKLITNVAQLQTVITKVKMFRAFLSDTQQLKKWEIHMKRGDGFFATVGNRFCFSEHFTPTDFNPLTSKPAETCLMPDDFTRQWGTPGSQ